MTERIIKDLENELAATAKRFEEELQTVRSGRPSVGLLEDIKVEYYGQLLPVRQLGSLAIRPPRDIEVQVWDKNAVGAVSKGIESAKAGFSVSTEGSTVRVTLPPLTDERRAELTKMVRKMSESYRISIRNHRDEAGKKLKSADDEGQANEDQVFRAKAEVQKAVDKANVRVEELLDKKLKELAD